MTATDTVIPDAVVPPQDAVPVFAVNKLVLLGLVGMVGALALLLFQALNERDEYRRAYRAAGASFADPLAHTANGKVHDPVTTTNAEKATESAADISASEM